MSDNFNPYINSNRKTNNNNQRKSISEQRAEIQNQINKLRSIRSEINDQELFLIGLFQQLEVEENGENLQSSHQQNQSSNDTYAARTRSAVSLNSSFSQNQTHLKTKTTARRNYTTPSSHASSSDTIITSIKRYAPNPHHPCSSFNHILGISATPSATVPAGFDRLGPFHQGDILQICNHLNGEFGKQGVFDRKSKSFVYFKNDRAHYQRAPQNLIRIHISEYEPW